MKVITILIAALMLSTGLSWAARPTLNFKDQPALALPSCEPETASVSLQKTEVKGSISSLPQGILVARESHFSVESRTVEGSLVRVQSFQSFVNSKLKSKAKVVCGSSELPFKERFSMMGPTLINIGSSRIEKNIFWQFQVLADNTLLSPWNLKSLSMSSSADIDKTLASLGYQTQIYKLKSNQYEIIYSQKQTHKHQTLSIIYDLD